MGHQTQSANLGTWWCQTCGTRIGLDLNLRCKLCC
jgi:hypothetical protein